MADSAELTKYVCLFHHRDHAAAALKDLEAAGVPRADTTVIANGANTYGDGYGYNAAGDLSDFGVPARDLKHLQNEVRGGGVVLIVEGVMDLVKPVEGIFHKHSANKIDETEAPTSGTYENEALATTTAPLATNRTVGTESGVIPVIEEELLVGKREVETGGVRVFSRSVDVPVSESVTLREEHAVIERTPVNRAVTDADLRTGQTIELTETAEEAVVGKVARVVEEVRVGKVASEHTETIKDSVRHTEVDVEPVETVVTNRKNY